MPKVATKNITQYNETFQNELSRLNDSQREAVEQIEGPVLVVAGPGTGKTHILTARIGRILMETDTQPHNILCLTFTEAGVHAMRERLLEFIGTEAHRVHIFTFHSFCNKIIQENLELFGRHDLEPLGDLERVEIVRRIIEELNVEHPLKSGRADIYFYENHLYNLFQMMKAEDWSAEYVSDQIDAFLEDLPNRKAFVYQVNRGDMRKGDLKMAKVEDSIAKMEKLRAAAALFPRFEQLKRQYRRYDFADMILWVLRIFEKNKALLRTYQEQYLYFLIDEYQDTNGAQNQIVQDLIHYWDNPNIFIVGDDDQSIYEFQGARLKNLTDFYEQYQAHLKLVILKENYRSSQQILNTARALITNNERRIIHNLNGLGIDKVLSAKHPDFATISKLPAIIEYPNKLQEEVAIVAEIEHLQKNDFSLDEVAIIYAKHKQVENIITLLEKQNIPYNTHRKINVLDLPMIQNLRLMLEYLQAEFQSPYSGEFYLFKILHFDFLKISKRDLAKIAQKLAGFGNEKKLFWRFVLNDLNALNDRKLLEQLENPKAIQDFSNLLEFLLSEIQNVSLPNFIEKIINRSGLLKYLLEQDNKIWLLQILHSFIEFVKKETDRNPRLNLQKLLETLKNMDGNRLAIEVQKTTVSEAGVNLLTAHSSKGLEFQKVFIIDAVNDKWEPQKKQGSYRFSMPDTLTFSGEEDALEARRRLFYVAMTRAKETLQISYAAFNNTGKGQQRAIFLEELLAENVDFQQKHLPNDELIEAQALLLSDVKPKIETQSRATISALLENFSLSVSSMNKFLRCPLSFYYENVLKVPIVESEMAAYGTAMHNALQRGFEKMVYSKNKSFPSGAEFVRLFELEIKKMYGSFSESEYYRRLEMGRIHLSEYYRQHFENWHKKVKLEHRITDAELDGVPINGTIDRLELYPKNQAQIVDYKTGSLNEQKMRRPMHLRSRKTDKTDLTTDQKYGGSYYRQLVFYKILLENSRYALYEARSGTISYLNPDIKNTFLDKVVQFTGEDASFVKSLITTVYTKIKAHDFYEGCGEHNCHWCNFVRHNVTVDSFADEEIEALDER